MVYVPGSGLTVYANRSLMRRFPARLSLNSYMHPPGHVHASFPVPEDMSRLWFVRAVSYNWSVKPRRNSDTYSVRYPDLHWLPQPDHHMYDTFPKNDPDRRNKHPQNHWPGQRSVSGSLPENFHRWSGSARYPRSVYLRYITNTVN